MIHPKRLNEIEQAALYEGDGYWEVAGGIVALELLREIRWLNNRIKEIREENEAHEAQRREDYQKLLDSMKENL